MALFATMATTMPPSAFYGQLNKQSLAKTTLPVVKMFIFNKFELMFDKITYFKYLRSFEIFGVGMPMR